MGVYVRDGVYVEPFETDTMVVAEAPGQVEQREGEPMLGKAGHLMHRLLRESGIREYYLTNVVKHRPPVKDRKQTKPTAVHIAACKPYLKMENKLVRPKVLILMGEVAAMAYLKPLFKGVPKMGAIVNQWFDVPEMDGVRALVLYHPSYLNRNEDKPWHARLLRDWKRELTKLTGAKPPTWAVREDPWGIMRLDRTARSVLDVESLPLNPRQKEPDPRYDRLVGQTVLPLTASEALTQTNMGYEDEVWAGESLVVHYGMFDLTHVARRVPDRKKYLRAVDVEDTMVMGYNLGLGDLSLKGMGSSWGINTVTYQNRHEIGDEQYNGQDVWLTKMGLQKLRPDVPLSYEIDRLLIPVLVEMQLMGGYHVDMDRLAEAIRHYERVKVRMEQMFYETYPLLIKHAKNREVWALEAQHDEVRPKTWPVGESIGSPEQLAELWGLDDTRKETLKLAISNGHPLSFMFEVVLQWRSAAKRLSSYLYKIQQDGRLAGLFNLTPPEVGEGGTATGRLSATNGMQTQPLITQRALMAPSGMRLRRGDYSQIELMAAAEISQAKEMIEVLNDPTRNLHSETRDQLKLCGPVPCSIKKCVHYTKAKNFNFGAGMYGGGAPYISSIVGCSIPEAHALMKEHRQGNFRGWWAYADEHWREVQRTGYSTEPVTGHRRAISLINPDAGRKQAINHPPQSLAVYVCKAAMHELWRENDSELVNQVHDAIHDFVDAEVDPDLQNKQMRDIMVETARKFLPSMNVRVDVQNSTHWEDTEE